MTKSRHEDDEIIIASDLETLEDNQHDELKDNIADILNELGGADKEVRITVYRVEKSKKPIWLFDFILGELEMSDVLTQLRDEHGGGEFRLRGNITGERGSCLNRIIRVESPKRNPVNPENIIEAVKSQMPTQNNNEFMGMILTTLNQQQQQSQQMMMQFMKTMSDNMKSMVESKAAPETPADTITMLSQVKGLFTTDNKSDDMATFLKGLEMGKEMGNEGSTMSEVIKTLGPPMAALAQRPMDAPPPRQKTIVEKQIIEKEAVPQEDIEPAEAEKGQSSLQVYISLVVDAAKKDLNPETYANLIIQVWGEKQVSAIINNDTAWNSFIGVIPESENYADWYAELRILLQEALNEELEEQHVPDETEVIEQPQIIEESTNIDGDTVRSAGDKNDS